MLSAGTVHFEMVEIKKQRELGLVIDSLNWLMIHSLEIITFFSDSFSSPFYS